MKAAEILKQQNLLPTAQPEAGQGPPRAGLDRRTRWKIWPLSTANFCDPQSKVYFDSYNLPLSFENWRASRRRVKDVDDVAKVKARKSASQMEGACNFVFFISAARLSLR
jgi:hypothetical protein